MVTVVLSLIIVGAIYLLYAQSVSAYRVQGQLLDMQDRLRFGMEHIKRDFRRTAFLATPNSNSDANVCPPPASHLRAITVEPFQLTPYSPFGGANANIHPTRITLFGDFFSGRAYKTQGIQDNKVYLTTPPAPMGEGEPDPFPRTKVEYDLLFNPYPNISARYLRIVTKDQFEIYLPIASADFDEKSITLQSMVPTQGTGNLCGIAGFGEGLEVNLAGFVRYSILSDIRVPDGSKTDLVREELRTDGSTLISNSQLVIAEFAVDLQLYDFGVDTANAGAAPSMKVLPLVTDVFPGGPDLSLGNTLAATPEYLRFVTIKLTVRSEEEDPNHFFTPRETMFHPIYGFELSDMEGACRTQTLASRVELTSMAVRNMQKAGGP